MEVDGEYRQLNANVLQIENEFYSFIRPKQIARSGEKPTAGAAPPRRALRRGARLDVDPFEPLGVSLRACTSSRPWWCSARCCQARRSTARNAARIERNQVQVATRGRDPPLPLDLGDGAQPVTQHVAGLLDAIEPVCELLDEAHGSTRYARRPGRAARGSRRPRATTRRHGCWRPWPEHDVPFFRFAMDRRWPTATISSRRNCPTSSSPCSTEEAARSLDQQARRRGQRQHQLRRVPQALLRPDPGPAREPARLNGCGTFHADAG